MAMAVAVVKLLWLRSHSLVHLYFFHRPICNPTRSPLNWISPDEQQQKKKKRCTQCKIHNAYECDGVVSHFLIWPLQTLRLMRISLDHILDVMCCWHLPFQYLSAGSTQITFAECVVPCKKRTKEWAWAYRGEKNPSKLFHYQHQEFIQCNQIT